MSRLIERQLQAIKNKAELHRWIDTLPDDGEGILLITTDDGPIKWYEYGEIDLKTTNWLIDHVKAFIIGIRDAR